MHQFICRSESKLFTASFDDNSVAITVIGPWNPLPVEGQIAQSIHIFNRPPSSIESFKNPF